MLPFFPFSGSPGESGSSPNAVGLGESLLIASYSLLSIFATAQVPSERTIPHSHRRGSPKCLFCVLFYTQPARLIHCAGSLGFAVVQEGPPTGAAYCWKKTGAPVPGICEPAQTPLPQFVFAPEKYVIQRDGSPIIYPLLAHSGWIKLDFLLSMWA